jgi:hypothetical protein
MFQFHQMHLGEPLRVKGADGLRVPISLSQNGMIRNQSHDIFDQNIDIDSAYTQSCRQKELQDPTQRRRRSKAEISTL